MTVSSVPSETLAYAQFDETQAPKVIVTFTGAKANDENFRAYLDGLEELYTRYETLAIVFDASRAGFPGLRYQRMQADWLKAHRAMMERSCAGTAYIIPNALIRTALKGIFALQNQPVPYHITGDLEDALLWAHSQWLDFSRG